MPQSSSFCACVYAIRAIGTPMVKIGSTGNLDKRLAALRNTSPVELELLAHWPGDRATEQAAHDAFASRRRHGEWFVFDSDEDPKQLIGAVVSDAAEPFARPAFRASAARSRRVTHDHAPEVVRVMMFGGTGGTYPVEVPVAQALGMFDRGEIKPNRHGNYVWCK